MSNSKTCLWLVFTLFSLFLLAEHFFTVWNADRQAGLKFGNGYIGLDPGVGNTVKLLKFKKSSSKLSVQFVGESAKRDTKEETALPWGLDKVVKWFCTFL